MTLDTLPLYWLSFADPKKPKGTQFLGAYIVEAEDFPGAILQANLRNCNPGGEMLGFPIEAGAPIRRDLTDKDLYRAIEREEMEARGWGPLNCSAADADSLPMNGGR